MDKLLVSPQQVSFGKLKISKSSSPMQMAQDLTDTRPEDKSDGNKFFNKKNLLIATGIGVLSVAAAIIFRGRPSSIKISKEILKALEDMVANGTVKKETVELIRTLIEENKLTNSKTLYEELCKYLKIKVPPAFSESTSPGLFGVYNPNLGTITVSREMPLGTMYHELIHFDQFQKIYRAFGKDAMIEAQVTQRLNALKSDAKFAQQELGKPFSEATKEELDVLAQKYRTKLNSEFNEEFYKKVAQENGELTAEEIQQAKSYLEALECPNHNATIIEREAYSKGLKFEEEVRKIINTIMPK